MVCLPVLEGDYRSIDGGLPVEEIITDEVHLDQVFLGSKKISVTPLERLVNSLFTRALLSGIIKIFAIE